jgi:hypothetical protein
VTTFAPTFTGTVSEQGRLTLDDRRAFLHHVYTFAGHAVELTVRRKRSQRSLDQNKFWWAVPVRLCAEHCGYSDSEMHYALLGECFGWKVGPTGKEIPNVTSSSGLTVEQFTHLIDWVLVWGPTELGVNIPAPDQVTV